MSNKHPCKRTHLIGIAVVLVILLLAFFERADHLTITEAHTHIQSMEKAEMLLKANRSLGINKTVLIPSPIETLTLNGNASFTKYEDNFDVILEISKKYPKNFIPFCTLSPLDENMMANVENCIQRGGKGIKLYNGHSYYYDIFKTTLNSDKMMSLYAFAERNRIPLLFHINITKYEDQLRDILDKHPALTVSVPHFMVSSIHLNRVTDLFDDYPNVYTDISFGAPEFMASGFRRLVGNIEKYGNFFNFYSDRILFGADMVLSGVSYKDQSYMEEILSCYKSLLTSRTFTCEPVVKYYTDKYEMQLNKADKCRPQSSEYCEKEAVKAIKYEGWVADTEKMDGFNLSKSVLRRIFETNPARWLSANQ